MPLHALSHLGSGSQKGLQWCHLKVLDPSNLHTQNMYGEPCTDQQLHARLKFMDEKTDRCKNPEQYGFQYHSILGIKWSLQIDVFINNWQRCITHESLKTTTTKIQKICNQLLTITSPGKCMLTLIWVIMSASPDLMIPTYGALYSSLVRTVGNHGYSMMGRQLTIMQQYCASVFCGQCSGAKIQNNIVQDENSYTLNCVSSGFVICSHGWLYLLTFFASIYYVLY